MESKVAMKEFKMLSFDVHKTMLNVKSAKKIKWLQVDQETVL
jgi:hypothetical protein